MVDVPHILLLSVYSSTAEFIAYILVNAIITGAIYCTPTIMYICIKGDRITEKGGKRFVLISCIVCWVLIRIFQIVSLGEASTNAAVFLWYGIASAIMHSFLKKNNKIATPTLKSDMLASYAEKDISADNQTQNSTESLITAENTINESNQDKELCREAIMKDRDRYVELARELKNFPVPQIKQWYAEGKLTEEQYKTSARKYNAIRKEMDEIKARITNMERNAK